MNSDDTLLFVVDAKRCVGSLQVLSNTYTRVSFSKHIHRVYGLRATSATSNADLDLKSVSLVKLVGLLQLQ
jgi:hypothetical protein